MTEFEDGPIENTLPEGFARYATITTNPGTATGFVLVDVSNLAHRASHAYNLTTSTGLNSGPVFGSMKLLMSTARNVLWAGSWMFVFCYDGAGAKTYRQALLDSYKSHRDPNRYNPVPEVKNVLLDVPGFHVEAPGFEGDDAIAAMAARLVKRYAGTGFTAPTRQDWSGPGKPIIVLSGDRDLWALKQYPDVGVWSPNLKRFVNTDDISDAYKTRRPELIYLAKSLFGDASDDIKGVNRLLKAQVEPHLNNPEVTDIESFYDAVDLADAATTSLKTKAKLAEAKTQVKTNFAVVTPRLDISKADVMTTPAGLEQKGRLLDSLARYECASLFSEVENWFGTPFAITED